jgi:FkbM family methyltransferase
MLIEPAEVKALFDKYNISAKGVLHVGSHWCQEKDFYNKILNVSDENIIWVDANKDVIEQNIRNGIPNCYTAALDETEQTKYFNITNNGHSSSLLELGTHKDMYPAILVSEKRVVRTQTLAQFFERNVLDISKYNIWNFDIQGSEYAVFKGSEHLLKYADVIYAEVNTDDVYKQCGKLPDLDELLGKHGLTRIITNMYGDHGWGDAIYIRN